MSRVATLSVPEPRYRLIVGADPLPPVAGVTQDYYAANILERIDGQWRVIALAHWHRPTRTLHNVISYMGHVEPSDETLRDLARATAATALARLLDDSWEPVDANHFAV